MQEAFSNVWTWLAGFFQLQQLGAVLRALALLAAGLVLARLARLVVVRSLAKSLSPQQLMLLRRAVSYTILVLFSISALRELGFNFGVLLGAAGIVTLAIGFASQTSVSNVISGLFLVFERAVAVGDVIRVESTTGEVLSIDLLSTKLRTFDNLLVRIPNETMVKAEITTLNRFPIRRVDIPVGVAYKEDLQRVQEVLFEVADKNPLCLEEPAPLLIAQGFGESSIDYQLSVWAKTENWLQLKNGMQQEIKEAFDADGIEIPFPHRTLYTGVVTDPFPFKLVGDGVADGVSDRAEE
ncbi:MAG: mechanosensitive ion channel family protein [Trueperaceae bacterium]|nr:MAG: mechanosensitive ion channel family protein [Trueperaceae bacterium]